MKNLGKKILTVMLSAVMFTSFMPSVSADNNVYAYAQEFSVSAEMEQDIFTVGQEIRVRAQAEGGYMGEQDKYLYKFEYYPVKNNSQWLTLQDFGTSQEMTLVFSEAGNYYFRTTAKDAKGYTVSNNRIIQVYNGNVNTTEISSQSITTGETLVIYPSFETDIPDNNDGYVYYRYKKSSESDNHWTEGYSQTMDKIELQFSDSGIYDLEVMPILYYGDMQAKRFSVTILSPLKNLSVISDSVVTQGKSISAKALAEGGKTPYKYACYYRKKGTEKWSSKGSFGTISEFTVTPASVGTYEICLKVKDADGTIEKKYFNITVTEKLQNISAMKNGSTEKSDTLDIAYGDKIRICGRSTGGKTPVTYTYFCKFSSDTKWTNLKPSPETDYTDITFKRIGTYDICVKVKDSEGTLVKKYMTVNVSPAVQELKNTSVLSNKDGTVKGDEIIIKAGDTFKILPDSTGGNAPISYICYYKAENNSKWSRAALDTENSVSRVTPQKTGKYSVCVYAKDHSGNLVKKYMSVTVSK